MRSRSALSLRPLPALHAPMRVDAPGGTGQRDASGRISRRAPVAQWIEQPPPKGQVGRSIRLRGALCLAIERASPHRERAQLLLASPTAHAHALLLDLARNTLLDRR